MPLIVRKRRYKSNRKKVFERGDLRLWLDTREGTRLELPKAVLELQQRDARHRTRWHVLWSGMVKIEPSGATVETTTPGSK